MFLVGPIASYLRLYNRLFQLIERNDYFAFTFNILVVVCLILQWWRGPVSASSSTSDSELRSLLIRLVLPIVVAILLVAVLDAALAWHGLKPRLFSWGKSFDDYNVVYNSALRDQRDGKRLVVFIGDSRVEWGLDPEAVQEVLQREVPEVSVYNLAIPGRNVRTMLTRLDEVGFYPSVLVVGYSHLSFYWSKNYVTEQPRRLKWWQSDYYRIHSFVERKVLAWPFAGIEIWNVLFKGAKITGDALASWLDDVEITPRGQARVHYRLAETDAIAFQQKFYANMYSVPMTDDLIAETNASFLKDMSIQRAHGTKVLLLKMPLSPWALALEEKNERTGLPHLAKYLDTPYFDGNDVSGASALRTFDGLHLKPPDAAVFSHSVAERFVLPYVR